MWLFGRVAEALETPACSTDGRPWHVGSARSSPHQCQTVAITLTAIERQTHRGGRSRVRRLADPYAHRVDKAVRGDAVNDCRWKRQ